MVVSPNVIGKKNYRIWRRKSKEMGAEMFGEYNGGWVGGGGFIELIFF